MRNTAGRSAARAVVLTLLRGKGCAFCVFATDLILPFTVLFMERTNRKLLAAYEEEAGKALLEEVDARSLLRRRGRFNAVRCCLPVLGRQWCCGQR
jgi:hypothetical protein